MFYFIRKRKVRRSTSRTTNNVDYRIHKDAARNIIISRLEYFALQYAKINPEYAIKMKYRRVSIRNQKSRWGSCSAQKNLNFNYRLVHLSAELRDYVVVHELCHLVELNHGPQFWALVERMIPNAYTLSNQVRRMPMDKVKVY